MLATESLLTDTFRDILQIVLAVVIPLVGGFVARYFALKAKKEGFETTEKEQDLLAATIEDGIWYAAQMAKIDSKKGRKTSSEEKKALAISFIKKLAAKRGIKETDADVISDMIEATLSRLEVET